MLKLPKNVLTHAKAPALEAYLAQHESPLVATSPVLVSRVPFDAPLSAGLRIAFGAGHLVQGLELIGQVLDRELKGIRNVQAKTGQAPVERLSRLVLLANDGSERFYRDAAGLLARHRERAWGLLVDTPGDTLGEGLTNKGNPAKALMIDDKDALGMCLRAWADMLSN